MTTSSPAPRALVNAAADPALVPPPAGDAERYHASLEGYEPTPLRRLDGVAAELGVSTVGLKDESSRLGLPAFKILGASWAAERALLARPEVGLLVAASAGNHGRAVARVAARRGLRARVYLPGRAAAARRDAIASEGAEVVVVDGAYEDAVARARADGARPGVLELTDVGGSATAEWVIDGYATLFAEAAEQGDFDLLLVPVGVGSLAAAAARFGAAHSVRVVGVEPVTAACLTASLAAGEPTAVETPGTTMAGLDCAEISPAAWPSLRHGVDGVVTVDDAEAAAATAELEQLGLEIGASGAAPLAALRALATDPACAALRAAVGLGPAGRVLLVATEGRTDRGPGSRR
ncbi:MAG TPA: pyridoxal-phosphate dependent enzyme [Gaiellaceae bacterium]|nr:pyridoxal-phosphate dependent enzyme [Gaiellaceae bacterium]